MGILVRNQKYNHYEFHVKGADVVMVKKISENEKIFVNEETEKLSNEGKIVKLYQKNFNSKSKFLHLKNKIKKNFF